MCGGSICVTEEAFCENVVQNRPQAVPNYKI